MTSEHGERPEPGPQDLPAGPDDPTAFYPVPPQPPGSEHGPTSPYIPRSPFRNGTEPRLASASSIERDVLPPPGAEVRDGIPEGEGAYPAGVTSPRYDDNGQLVGVTPAGAPPDGGEPAVMVAEEPAPPPRRRSSGTRILREIIETVVLAAVIFLGVRAVVQNFKVEGSSMYPSFYDGEYMLVNKAVYSRIDLGTIHKFLPFISPGSHPKRYIFHGPQRGDVIVFVPPVRSGAESKDFIKRVIGLPGDTVEIRDNHVYVNDKLVSEPYINVPTTCPGEFCKVTLQQDQYYVMGDNRGNSSDSRFWGPVSADKIIGKALLTYYCGGTQCKGRLDHFGFSPNHSTVLTPQGTPP